MKFSMKFFKPTFLKPMTTKEIIFDSKNLPVDISKVEWVLKKECDEALEEAIDILRSVAAAGGFSILFRAREWLKKYGSEK